MLENLYVKLQSSVAFFQDMSLAEIESIVKAAPKKVLAKDELVFKEGTVGGEMYLILSGSVRLEQASKPHQAVLKLGYGQYFGELGLLTKRPRTFSVYADQDRTSLLIMNEHQITKNYALAYRFFKQIVMELSQRTRALNEQYLAKKRSVDLLKESNEKRFKKVYNDRLPFKSIDWDRSHITSMDFSASNFQEATLTGSTLQNVRIESCNIKEADFSVSQNSMANVRGGKFNQANFTAVTFKNVVFSRCTFEGANWNDAGFTKTSLTKE